MRRLTWLWMTVLVLGACSPVGGGSATSTMSTAIGVATSSTAVPSASDGEWTSTVMDAAGATGQRPMLTVDDAGRVAVVFQRETTRDDYDIVLGHCLDQPCSDVTEVVLASGRYFPVAVGATADGPFAVGFLLHEDGRGSMAVWSCSDALCSSDESATRTIPVALYANPGELPLIAYVDASAATDSDPSAFDVVIGFCADTSCSTHTPVTVNRGSVGFDWSSGSLQKQADGSPVLFFPGAEDMDTVWDVIVCKDPKCSEVEIHHQDGTWPDGGGPAPAGVPSQVYVASEEIRQLACVDEACTAVTDSLIQRMDQAEAELRVSADYVDDRLVLLTRAVDEPPEQPEEDGFLRYRMTLFTCGETGCSPTPQPPVAEGLAADMVATGDDSVAVVVQTGRAVLCNPQGESCVDPDEALSQLTLHTTQILAE